MRRSGIGPAGGIGQVDGALDPVAKAKFLGQLDGQVPCREDMAVGADPLHQVAAVMREHLRLHGLHDVRPAEVDFLRRRGRFC